MAQDLVIGIDVGGQTAKCGVVDARGNIVAQTVISSENTTNADEFVTALAEALNRIIVEAKAEGPKAASAASAWASRTVTSTPASSRTP